MLSEFLIARKTVRHLWHKFNCVIVYSFSDFIMDRWLWRHYLISFRIWFSWDYCCRCAEKRLKTAYRHGRMAINSIYKFKFQHKRFHKYVRISHEISIKYLPCIYPVASASSSWTTRTCSRTCELGLDSLNYSCYVYETFVKFYE